MIHDDNPPQSIPREVIKVAFCTLATVTITKLVEAAFDRWKQKREAK